jgi:tRNA 2-thiouridine synthesizing protein C
VSKRFLFILRQPPRSGIRAKETLDMVLTLAAFDQTVGILFTDDGVYQLQPGQQDVSGAPVMSEMLGALSLYEVDSVWVEQESLQERGLTESDTVIPVCAIARSAVAELLAAHDVVMAA